MEWFSSDNPTPDRPSGRNIETDIQAVASLVASKAALDAMVTMLHGVYMYGENLTAVNIATFDEAGPKVTASVQFTVEADVAHTKAIELSGLLESLIVQIKALGQLES